MSRKISFMVNLSAIIRRAKDKMHFTSDKEFANILGLSAPDFSKRKKIGTLLPIIIEWGIAEKVNLDWLLTGEGSPYKETSLTDRMDEGPVIAELLNAVRTVLKSDDPAIIDAIERNIRYFAHAIEVERRYDALETRISALEQERKKAAEKIREGDPLEEKDEIIKMRAI